MLFLSTLLLHYLHVFLLYLPFCLWEDQLYLPFTLCASVCCLLAFFPVSTLHCNTPLLTVSRGLPASKIQHCFLEGWKQSPFLLTKISIAGSLPSVNSPPSWRVCSLHLTKVLHLNISLTDPASFLHPALWFLLCLFKQGFAFGALPPMLKTILEVFPLLQYVPFTLPKFYFNWQHFIIYCGSASVWLFTSSKMGLNFNLFFLFIVFHSFSQERRNINN